MKRAPSRPVARPMHEHPAMYALTAVVAVLSFVTIATASLANAQMLPGSLVTSTPQAMADRTNAGIEDRSGIDLACTRKYTGCITAAMFLSQGQALPTQENFCMDGYRSCKKGAMGLDGKPEYERYR